MSVFLPNTSITDGFTDNADEVRNSQDPRRRAENLEDYRVGLLVDLMVLEATAEKEARSCLLHNRPASRKWWSLEADLEYCSSAIEEIPSVADLIREREVVSCARSDTHFEDRVWRRLKCRAARLLRESS